MKILIPIFLLFNFYTNADALKLTTYNLGLAHTFVPLAKERLKPITDRLASYDTDVLCLQEVWKKRDQKKVRKALKEKYPYSFSTKIKNYREGGIPTCKISQLFGKGKFISCMQKQCGGKEGDDFTDCIINSCGDALEKLKNTNRTCASALMAQVGKSPIASMVVLLNPFIRAGQFAYKGSNGLMIFSRYPITETKYLDLKEKSTLNKRGALTVNINVLGRRVQVMCTHLTADLSATVPYTGVYADWEEENYDQLNDVLMKANHQVVPTALMGDFNCGFENTSINVSPELAGSCQQALDWGYRDTLSENAKGCTFCKTNLLNDGEEENVAIDHIFVKGMSPITDKIIFDEVIKVPVDGGFKKTQYSDHYGYELTVELGQ